MQSTPSQSASSPGEFALFGSYSPIVGNGPMGGLGAFGGSSTPLPSSSRTHKLINSENQLERFKRPVSPTRLDSEPIDMMQPLGTSVEAVCSILYQDELTEQEKRLTVAEFIHQNIEKRIRMIEEHGEKRIQEVKRRAEELKQQIRDSPS
jgi:hypothetical protein